MDNKTKTKAGKETVQNLGMVNDLMHSGGVYRGKGGRFVSKSDAGDNAPEFYQTITKTPLSFAGLDKVAESMKLIASSLKDINSTIKSRAQKGAYEQEEKALEARKPETPQAEQPTSIKEEASSLFSNPAFMAALAGIVYAVLPEDVQKKINALFGGFTDKLSTNVDEMGNLGTAIKVAAGGLALFIGGKFVKNITDMITSMVKIGKRIGKMGKLGKAAAALTVGAVAVDYATDKMKEDKEGGKEGEGGKKDEGGKEPTAKPEAGKEATSAPAATPEEKPAAAATTSAGVELPGKTAEGKEKKAAKPGSPKKGPGFNAGVSAMNSAISKEGITNPVARAQILAQTAHESGGFKYSEELASGQAYEGRKDLGNVEPGDGIKYKGRGFLQITGRSNYAAISKDLGYNFVEDPDKLSDPKYAAESALWFLKRPFNARRIKDWGDTKAVTKVVNGGYNGLAERENYFAEFSSDSKLADAGSAAAPSPESASAPQLEVARPGKGQQISEMTQDVKQKTVEAKQTAPVINNVDMSKTKGVGGSKVPDMQAPIPSPIASRGSLNIGTTHSASA
jgi:predicted chitinase